MFAYIPARGGSQRLPRKNIKPLGKIPVIGHVIKTLKSLSFLSAIYVSTDDPEIRAVSESFGANCLEYRAEDLSNSKAGFTDLIRQDIPRFMAEENSSDVLFVLPTAALVPQAIYEDAYQIYRADKPEILMSCEPYPEPVWWAFEQTSDGYWSPLFPDKVTINSQDLPKTLTDSGLFYFFDQTVLKNYACHKLANKLQAYDVPHTYRCDVNDEEDWERLEWKYQRLEKLHRKGI